MLIDVLAGEFGGPQIRARKYSSLEYNNVSTLFLLLTPRIAAVAQNGKIQLRHARGCEYSSLKRRPAGRRRSPATSSAHLSPEVLWKFIASVQATSDKRLSRETRIVDSIFPQEKSIAPYLFYIYTCQRNISRAALSFFFPHSFFMMRRVNFIFSICSCKLCKHPTSI